MLDRETNSGDTVETKATQRFQDEPADETQEPKKSRNIEEKLLELVDILINVSHKRNKRKFCSQLFNCLQLKSSTIRIRQSYFLEPFKV